MAAKKNSSSSISYSDLVAQIKNKQFAPVYLLHGEEPFFIDRLCKMFEDSILEPEERDFNQVVLYGKDTSVDMVLANAKQFAIRWSTAFRMRRNTATIISNSGADGPMPMPLTLRQKN